MNDKIFGEYLRSLRKSQNPPMTQEQLAKAIGRSKMTVSQFEKGKNAPPQGELLEKIISTLTLTTEQENRLRFCLRNREEPFHVILKTTFLRTPPSVRQ